MVKESSWLSSSVVHVNVGGLRHSLSSRTLRRFPDTRLGKLLSCCSEEEVLEVCDDYDVQQQEFYFDRNPGLFPYVLHFYQTGKLHVMEELCVFSFSQEIEYWGINEFFLDSCCSFRFHDRKLERRHHSWDDESDASSIDTSEDEISDLNKDLQHFHEVRYGNMRKRLWLTLENPGYSIPSKMFSLLSISVVLTSISTMCIQSIPEYQIFDSDLQPTYDPTLQSLEMFCTCWFTFEKKRKDVDVMDQELDRHGQYGPSILQRSYGVRARAVFAFKVVMRLLLAPNQRKFFYHPLNIIDMVSVVPIYITLIFDLSVGSESELGELGRLVQVFRLMRIFRVLKLARHSTGLRSLGATLKHSYREVGILLLYLAVGVSVFSGVAYTAECEEDVGLDTIPACWWWGMVSMTTVGYGDVVPVTVVGKLAASGCILGGTLVVALPITLIFNKFSHFYRKQKALEASVRDNHQGSCENVEGSDDDDEVEYERGGVVNYSYVHPSYTSVLRRKARSESD